MDIQDSIQALKLPENRDMIHRSPNVLTDGSTTKACMGGISEESINITAKKMKNGTIQTWKLHGDTSKHFESITTKHMKCSAN